MRQSGYEWVLLSAGDTTLFRTFYEEDILAKKCDNIEQWVPGLQL
jgi:hypothetical protein